MKTQVAIVTLLAVLVIGCDHSKEEQLEKQLSVAQTTQLSLQQSISDRDKYFEDIVQAINDVYTDIEKARVKEGKLVKSAGGTEGPFELTNDVSRQKLLQNITDIGTTLKSNWKRIAGLEARMKSFRGEVAGLNKMIENLKQSLKEREASIAELDARVRGLEDTVAENTKVIAEKDGVIDSQQKTMNTAYFVVGTRKELKDKGIITDEGGFLWGLLGSTTVMASGVDPTLFTPIDRTKEQSISVHGDIDEILPHRNDQYFATSQPVADNTQLSIVQPSGFWQDKYLVIVTD